MNDEYIYQGQIGAGGFGVVTLVKSRSNNCLYAKKAIEFDDEKDFAENLAEIKALQAGNKHNHIVQLIDHFPENSSIYSLIFEYCELGDLSDYIKKRPEKKIEVALAIVFLKQIADALHFIHSKPVIHRDVKPLNILLKQGSDGQIIAKLADFGISKLATRASTAIGTKKYMAPEIFRGEEHYTKKVDMWGLGCTYFEMILGESLIRSNKTDVILNELKTLPTRFPTDLDEFSNTLLTGLLYLNPMKRLSAQEVVLFATNAEHFNDMQRLKDLYERSRFFSDRKCWDDLKALAEDNIDNMKNFSAKAFAMIIYSRGSITDVIPTDNDKANELSAAVRPRLEQEDSNRSILTYPYVSYALGVIYQDGLGVPRDYNIAFAHYKNSAEQEYANAQNSLSFMYENGLGVDTDYETAFKWLFKAAQQDNAHAQNNLGNAYERGIGVNADYEKAFEWYLKAAVQGHPIAQSNLGRLYEQGVGATADREKALEWYSKAAEKGETVLHNPVQNIKKRRREDDDDGDTQEPRNAKESS